MLVNVVEAKSNFSSLLSHVGTGKEEVIIARRNKPVAVLIPFETFQEMKQGNRLPISRDELDRLPTSFEQFRGILSEENADLDWKQTRETYLREKYL